MAEKINVMPYNLEAEQSLLGCVLVDFEIQLETLAQLCEEDFYTQSHKIVLSAMKEIVRLNKPVDIVTLTDIMEKNATLEQAGGISYITSLAKSMPSSANYKYYLDIVKRDSTLRKLIRSSEEITKEARQSTNSVRSLEFAEDKIFKISQDNETSNLVSLTDSYDEFLSEIEKMEKDKNYKQGLKTGFTRIDDLTNGFRKGNLVILAARPSDGKTTLALNMIENIALRENKICAMFALEMTKTELAQKLLCSIGKVKMDSVMKGKLSTDDEMGWKRLWDAKKKLSKTNIYVDDSPTNTVPTILSKCRRLKATKGLDFVVVDHIQLIYPENRTSENRQQEVTEISRGLKVLAKDLGVPVLALSQLSRGVTQRKGRPMLSDLRESGAIEQDADIVMFIYRPDKNADPKEIASGAVERNVAEIIIEKNRSGERGSAKLLFKGEFSRFVNISNYQEGANGYVAQEQQDDEIPPSKLEKISELDVDSYSPDDIPPEDDELFGSADEVFE